MDLILTVHPLWPKCGVSSQIAIDFPLKLH